jgi:predicted secreted protein
MPYANSQAIAGRGSILQFGTGSVSPYTFSVLAEVKKIQFSGSKYDLADVTNFESGTFREWLPTLADSGEISFEANLIPSDASQAALLTAFNNATLQPWQVVLPNSVGTFAFNAYVSSLERDIPLDKEATISGKLKVTGQIQFYQ